MSSYDAVLFVSFGGPEGPDDVMPFLKNVLRGRNVPRERMMEVAQHYQRFGGVSPINGQIRELIAAFEKELDANGPHLPVYWGNRNWHPMLVDTIQQMKDDGIQRAIAFVTSAFSSYSGCRQYQENIQAAREAVGGGVPEVDKLRVYYNHPGFVIPMTNNVKTALTAVAQESRDTTPLVFTAHSIPLSMSESSRYQWQLRESCGLVAERVGANSWNLVFQSRSGAPHHPWLEPDVCDYITETHAVMSMSDIIIMPIGFISDHIEVMFDLDTEANDLCNQLGIRMHRSATVGTDPQFVQMIRQLVQERIADSSERLYLGDHGPSHDVCPRDCCLAGPRGAPLRTI